MHFRKTNANFQHEAISKSQAQQQTNQRIKDWSCLRKAADFRSFRI